MGLMADGVPPRHETGGVPSPSPDESAGLAWSSENDFRAPPPPPRKPVGESAEAQGEPETATQSWSTVWSRAAALLLIGVGLATVIIVASLVLTTKKTTTANAPPVSTAPATTSPLIAESITSTPAQDEEYIRSLNDRGISFSNPKEAVLNGKTVCQNISAGSTVQAVVTDFQTANPTYAGVANAYVAISVRTYCPQFNDLVVGM
ncbi:hypothetical protein MBOU_14180 [Mycobacterium bourgelatii]|uniref:DUF732 domain-containing protein n=2 Tax=Mycobacterium bourgelatii TaxID=1273442 RepID=A0A7I9YL21_MYCBU|nr:hypothetical protein MBOU_14180 [Mycobacterium bourgelatii]